MGPVTVLGRVSPSTPAGRLGLSGPVSFAPSSTFEVDIGPGNAGDRLEVAGAVTIQPGATLSLLADPAIATTTVPVLTASAISGQFNATDYAFFTEIYDYQPTSLTVTLTSTGQNFSSFAYTPNQRAVAQVLDAAAPTATGDLDTVFTSLDTALATEIAPLLDAIGGESLTAFATARQILGERTARAIQRRTRDPAFGEGRAFYLYEERQGDERPLIDRVRPGAWFDALGVFGRLDGDTGEADVDTLLYGGTLGADATIAEHVVVGLAAGYARSDVDLDHREADVFGDTVQGALYTGFVDPRGYVSGYGRYAYTFQDSTRRIESSTLSRRARADWDAQDYGAGAEAGVTLVSYRGFALQPVAGVDWLRLTEESYTESGAGSLDLIVDPETLESTTARFGARAFGRLDMGDPGVLVPELRAFYQHLYGDRERVLDATLVGTPGLPAIGVRGAEFPRDTLLLGVGWGVIVTEQLRVSFDYDAVLGSDRAEHQGTIAARVLF
jgi:outer membrane autotransporter protein